MSLRGEKGWIATYQKQFGATRWKGLYKHLKSSVQQVALLNHFMPVEEIEELKQELGLIEGTVPLTYVASKKSKEEKTAEGDEKKDDEAAEKMGESPEATEKKTPTIEEQFAAEQAAEAELLADKMKSLGISTAAEATASAVPSPEAAPQHTKQEITPGYKFGGKSLGLDMHERVLQDCNEAENPFSMKTADLLTHYFLDGASVLCAQSLGPFPVAAPEEPLRVLDMCAAPGGKSIVLLMMLYQDEMKNGIPKRPVQNLPIFVTNEFSKSRFQRLEKSLRQFVPPKLFFGNVHVTNCDATCVTRTSQLNTLGPYDRILVDVPCSTDRHLLKSKMEMLKWCGKTPQQSADRQMQLLWSAVWMCKVGGEIVYSTCALSDIENNQLIKKFQEYCKKARSASIQVEVVGESRLYLPDEPHRFGPLFVCKLRKVKGPVGVPPPMKA